MSMRVKVKYSDIELGLRAWLDKNLPKTTDELRWVAVQNGYLDNEGFFLEFKNEQDATFFTLAWGN
jgi:hypothetical protein